MGYSETDREGDGWMLQQNVIHLTGRDLLAATIDDLFEPTGDEQIAVSVKIPLIASTKPPVDESLLIDMRRPKNRTKSFTNSRALD